MLLLSGCLQKLKQLDRAAAAQSETVMVLTGTGAAPPSPAALVEVREVIRSITRPVWVICGSYPWFPTVPPVPTTSTGAHDNMESIIQPKEDLIKVGARATGLMTAYDYDPDKKLFGRARGPLASAVVISDHYVLTNRHVIDEGRIGFKNVGDNTWRLFPQIGVKIEFPLEYDKCAAPTRRRK